MSKEEGGGGEGVEKEDAGAVHQCNPTAAGLADGGVGMFDIFETLIFDRWSEC